MANNNLSINLSFTADTQKAKAELENLQTALNNLTLGNSGRSADAPLTQQILNAQKAAGQLSISLKNATNVDTGKLNLTKFSSELEKSGMSLKDYRIQLSRLGQDGQKAFLDLTKQVMQADVAFKTSNKLVDSLWKSLKNVARWQISGAVIRGFVGGVQSAFGYAKDLNESLNNIRIVTQKSTADMAQFAVQANRAAKELSTTTTAYTDAALIYYQQGLSDEAVQKRADITIKAANAAGTNAEEMSSYLTAVWNSYKVGEDELEKFVDIMAALGAGTATSLEEISTAMEKVASVGEATGVSFEQLSSIIATVSSVTRTSAESVGTAYKTIFARMADLKLEGSIDEDGVTTTLGTVSSQLAQVGVNILNDKGELRDMGKVIEELMSKWDGMNAATQQAVAIAIAGKRQYTQLLALMNNQDMYKDAMNLATGAEGTLEKQNEIYAESWEAASKRVKAAAEGIYDSLLNDKFFIGLNNTLADTLGFIEKLIDSLGGLPGVLGVVGVLMTKAFGEHMATSIANMSQSIFSMTAAGRQASTSLKQDFMTEAQILLDKRSVNYDNREDEITNRILKERLELYNQHLEKAKSLSEREIQLQQLLLDSNEEEAKKLKILAQQYDVERDRFGNLDHEVYTTAQTNINNISDSSERQGMQSLFSELYGDFKNTQGLVQFQDMSLAEGGLNSFKEALLQIDETIIGTGNTYGELLSTLNQTEGYQNLDNYLTKLKAEFQDIDLQTVDSKEKWSEYKDKLNEVGISWEQVENAFAQTSGVTAIQEYTDKLKELDGIFQDINYTDDNWVSSLQKQAQAMLGNENTSTELKEKISALLSIIQQNTEGVTDSAAGYEKLRDILNNSNRTYENALQNFRVLGQLLGIDARRIEELIESSQNMIRTNNQVNKSFKNFIANSKDIKTSIQSFNTGFEKIGKGSVQVISSLSSITMGITSLTSVVNTLNNENLSFFEKFSQVTMSLSIGIPALLSGFIRIKDGFNLLKTGALDAFAGMAEASFAEMVAVEGNTIAINDNIKAKLEKAGVEMAVAESSGMLTIATTAENQEIVKNIILEEQRKNLLQASLGQKILFAIATKAGLAPMITENGQILLNTSLESKNLIGKTLLTIAKWAGVAATEGETAALEGEAAAATAANLATLPLTATIWLLVAAIAAVVAVAWLLVKAFQAWKDSTPEAQMKKLDENAKMCEDSVKNLTTKIEDLKTKIESLNESYDTFKNLKQGTEEWQEQLRKTNDQALELINTYKDLEYSVDPKTGLIKIDQKSLDNGIEDLNKSRNAAQTQALKYSGEAEQIASKESFRKLLHEQASDVTAIGDTDSIEKFFSILKEEYKKQGNKLFTEESIQTFVDQYQEELTNVYSIGIKNILDNYTEENKIAQEQLTKVLKDAIAADKKIDTSKLITAGNVKSSLDSGQSAQDIAEKYDEAFVEARNNIVKDWGHWNFSNNYDKENHLEAEKAELLNKYAKTYFGEDYIYDSQGFGEAKFYKVNENGEKDKKSKIKKSWDEILDGLASLNIEEVLSQKIIDGIKKGFANGEEMTSDTAIVLDNFINSLSDDDQKNKFKTIIEGLSGDSLTEFTEAIRDQIDITSLSQEQIEKYQESLDNLSEAYDTNGASSDQFKNALKDLEEVTKRIHAEQALPSLLSEAANTYELDPDDLENMANAMMKLGEAGDKAYKDLSLSAEGIRDAAVASLRLDKGILELSSHYEDYESILKSAKNATNEIDKANIQSLDSYKKLRTVISNLLNISEDMVSIDLVKAIDPKTLEEAAYGSEQAIQKLRDAFVEIQAEALGFDLNDAKSEIQSIQDSLANGNEVSLNLETDSFLYKLINAELAAGHSAEEINKKLNGLGLSLDYEDYIGTLEEAKNYAHSIGGQIAEEMSFGTEIQPTEASILKDEEGLNVQEEFEANPGPIIETETVEGFNEDTETTQIKRLKYQPVGYKKSVSSQPTKAGTVEKGVQGFDLNLTHGKEKHTVVKGLKSVPIKVPSNTKTSAAKSMSSGKGSGGSKGGGGGGSKGSKPKSPQKTKVVKPEFKREQDEVTRYKNTDNLLASQNQNLEKIQKQKEHTFGTKHLKAIDAENKALLKENEILQQQIEEAKKYEKIDLQTLTEYGKAHGIELTPEIDENGFITNFEKIQGRITEIYNKDIEQWYADAVNAENAAWDAIVNKAGEDGPSDAQKEAHDQRLEDLEEEKKKREESYSDAKDALSSYEEATNKAYENAQKIEDNLYKIKSNHLEKINKKIEQNIQLLDNESKILDTQKKMLKDNDKFWTVPELFNKSIQEVSNTLEKGNEYVNQYNEIMSADLNENEKAEALQQVFDNLQDAIGESLDKIEEMKEAFGDLVDKLADDLNKVFDKFGNINSVLDSYKSLAELIGEDKNYRYMNRLLTTQQRITENQYKASKDNFEMWQNQYNTMNRQLNNMSKNDEGYDILKKNIEDIYEQMTSAQKQLYDDAEKWVETLASIKDLKLEELFDKLEKKLTDNQGFDLLKSKIDTLKSEDEYYLTATNQQYETQKLIRQAQRDLDKATNQMAKNRLQTYIDQTAELQKQSKLSKLELQVQQERYNLTLAEIALQEAQENKSQVTLQRDSEGNFNYVYTADEDKIAEAQQKVEDSQNNIYNLLRDGVNNFAEAMLELDEEYVNAIQDIDLSTQEGREKFTALQQQYLKKRNMIEQQYNYAAEQIGDELVEAYGDDIKANILSTEDFGEVTDKTASEMKIIWNDFQDNTRTVKTLINEDLTSMGQESENLKNQIIDLDRQGSAALNNMNNVVNNWAQTQLGLIQQNIDAWAALGQEIQSVLRMSSGFDYDVDYMQRYETSTSVGQALEALNNRDFKVQEDEYKKYGENYEELQREFRDQSNQILSSTNAVGALDAAARREAKLKWFQNEANRHGDHINPYTMVDSTVEFLKKYFESYSNLSDEKNQSAISYLNSLGNKELTDTELAELKKKIGLASSNYIMAYATGGYTGDFENSSEGKLALLHEKELVLNKDDTRNFLQALDLTSAILENLKFAKIQYATNFNSTQFGQDIGKYKEQIEQSVHISADFPNVTDHNEIEIAIENLINTSAQFAARGV